MTCSYTLTLWENSIFLNKNSTRVQAKHSLQAHFHLLKSSILTQTHTSDTHCLFQLSTGAQSGTVSPGARPEPSTRIKPLTPWSCFQMDHVTHQKRHKRGNGMTEESQREIMNGEKMKKKENQSVLTVVLVWDWTGREALEETGACFCSDDCREK